MARKIAVRCDYHAVEFEIGEFIASGPKLTAVQSRRSKISCFDPHEVV